MTDTVMDASSLLLCIKRYGDQAYEILKLSSTIPLIYYEVGNALRTSAAVLHHITPEEAKKTLEHIHQGLALMEHIGQDNPQDSKQVLQNSIIHGLTYYDSAYLTAAENNGATLVTDDKKLAKAAGKADVPTVDIDSLYISAHPRKEAGDKSAP